MEDEKKSLKQKFMEGKKLGLIDKLKIKLLQNLTNCDERCNECTIWYCNIYKNQQEKYISTN